MHGSQRGLIADFDDVATAAERKDDHPQEIPLGRQENSRRDSKNGTSSQLSDAQEEAVCEKGTAGGSHVYQSSPLATEGALEEAEESIIAVDERFVPSRSASHDAGSQRAAEEVGSFQVEEQGDAELAIDAQTVIDANDGGGLVVLEDDDPPLSTLEMMPVEPLDKELGLLGPERMDSSKSLERVPSSGWSRSVRVD